VVKVKLHLHPTSFALSGYGTVCASQYGTFRIIYRGQTYTASSIGSLHQQLATSGNLDRETKTRAVDLRTMAAPAMYFDGARVEDITVRGRDRRTDKMLITRTDGRKARVDPHTVFRPLTHGECIDFLAVVKQLVPLDPQPPKDQP